MIGWARAGLAAGDGHTAFAGTTARQAGCAYVSGVNGISLPSEVLFNHGPFFSGGHKITEMNRCGQAGLACFSAASCSAFIRSKE